MKSFHLRQRLIYLAAALIIIPLGLASRKFPDVLPDFVVQHFGDALWAAFAYFGFRVLFPKMKVMHIAVIALLFSFADEFSQLYKAPWIDALRRTTLGALILGSGFLYIDLVRYAFGVAFAALLDYFWLEKIAHSSSAKVNT